MDRISGRSLAARLFGASPARTLALLEAAWPLAVGPELARRTEVLGIEGGTLRVRVPDAGWRKVLHRMQPQILGHLREIAGDLAPRRMGFVEGGFAVGLGGDPGAERHAVAVSAGGFQGGSQPTSAVVAAVRTPTSHGVSAAPNQPQSEAAPRSGGDARGGFQGGSRTPISQSVSAPPEINDVANGIADPEIRARFLATMARYLERSKGRNDA